MRFGRSTIALACGLVLAAAPIHAQTAGQTQTPPPAKPVGTGAATQPETRPQEQTPPPTPENLERIRKALDKPATLNLENNQPRFYVEINAWRSFVDFTKGYDFVNGAGPANKLTSAELFALTQPRDMYGSAGIQPAELLTGALVNYFGQMLIKKGFKELAETRDEKRIREIRAQIDRELAALKGGR